MKRTIIDIGTNTILMLIADFDSDTRTIKTLMDVQRIPRLGKGVDNNKNILPESAQKAIEVLNEYKKISSSHASEKITATATSFIRDSNNKNEFISEIKQKTGIEIEVLSGDDEAKWTFWGGVYDKIKNDNAKITVIDIGGGSTEVTSGKIAKLPQNKNDFSSVQLNVKSINVGSVRVNEKFLSAHPPSFDNIIM